uniref:Uncharacterized protein n=1 Tax=Arundo donax TaxID=35708 RepID=A0A0A9GN90_ARUDO
MWPVLGDEPSAGSPSAAPISFTAGRSSRTERQPSPSASSCRNLLSTSIPNASLSSTSSRISDPSTTTFEFFP